MSQNHNPLDALAPVAAPAAVSTPEELVPMVGEIIATVGTRYTGVREELCWLTGMSTVQCTEALAQMCNRGLLWQIIAKNHEVFCTVDPNMSVEHVCRGR